MPLAAASVLVALLILIVYWRKKLFFRDPERAIPPDDVLVSAADGHVVYVRKFAASEVPIAVKKGRSIPLSDLLKSDEDLSRYPEWYDIGVFMHPTSVHVNRSPIDGVVGYQKYARTGINLPMTIMWIRVLFRMRPFERGSKHIAINERNVIRIDGQFPVYVIQIADIYVNKIDSWVDVGKRLAKGERLGRIIMGSQVDVLVPVEAVDPIVNEGEKVYAGSSAIARIRT